MKEGREHARRAVAIGTYPSRMPAVRRGDRLPDSGNLQVSAVGVRPVVAGPLARESLSTRPRVSHPVETTCIHRVGVVECDAATCDARQPGLHRGRCTG